MYAKVRERRIAIDTVLYECICGIFLVCNKNERKEGVVYSATIASRKLLINVID